MKVLNKLAIRNIKLNKKNPPPSFFMDFFLLKGSQGKRAGGRGKLPSPAAFAQSSIRYRSYPLITLVLP